MQGTFHIFIDPLAPGSLAFVQELEKECTISSVSSGEYIVEGKSQDIDAVIADYPQVVIQSEAA